VKRTSEDVILVLVMTLPTIAYSAFVWQCLWSWFVTPIFAITAPSLWACAGLMIFIQAIMPTVNGYDTPVAEGIVQGFITRSIYLAVGYVVYLIGGVA